MIVYIVTAPDLDASTFSSGIVDLGAFADQNRAKEAALVYNKALVERIDHPQYFSASIRPVQVIE